MATYYPTSYISTQQQQLESYQESDASFLELFSNNMQPRIENNRSLDEEHTLQYQELSLSLGMQKNPSFQYNYINPQLQESREHGSQSNKIENFDYSLINISDSYQIPSGVVARICNSRYLKASQELLEEVANLNEAIKQLKMNRRNNMNKFDENNSKIESQFDRVDVLECVTSSSGELSVSEKQDLQNKITKLFSFVDEVDRKYREYCQQLRIVESTLDTVMGCGSARSYTTLAHQTISRHFRCLRDAINEQIQVARQRLGEQDDLSDRVLPRLRNVEKQLRQQRTGLNPLGVMRHSWRPQRGLPENSVSILRAWLFEHFLNPYPKDSEKILLAKQTGLTRSQIANWFINARVRLWKPMVEDMYKEEFRDQEVNGNSLSLEEKTKDLQKNTTFMAPSILQSSDSNQEFISDLADQYRFDESDFVVQ